ncbi:MAG TPA: hypothetical protein VF365_00470 [Candidatus Limnocylindria bacterium]
MSTEQLPMWVFAIGTALAVIVGLVATRVRREWLARLPFAHVAAATLIGAAGWEALVNLPGTIQAYLSTVAGIANPDGVGHVQAFAVASAAFVVAAVLAVLGILRRRPWGVVTGAGLAATMVAMSIGSTASIFTFADSFPPDQLGQIVGTLFALNAVPPLVAIALLAWPLLGGRSAAPAAPRDEGDWTVEAPSPEPGR